LKEKNIYQDRGRSPEHKFYCTIKGGWGGSGHDVQEVHFLKKWGGGGKYDRPLLKWKARGEKIQKPAKSGDRVVTQGKI